MSRNPSHRAANYSQGTGPVPNQCSVEGCPGGNYADTLCKRHWRNRKHRGDVGLDAPPVSRPGRCPKPKLPCSVEGCEQIAATAKSGLCQPHKYKNDTYGDPLYVRPKAPPVECTIGGCVALIHARGWCAKHYQRWETHGDPEHEVPVAEGCLIDGCREPHHGKGYCRPHYARFERWGDPNTSRPERTLCSVEGCELGVQTLASGLCSKHLYRSEKYGDPLATGRPKAQRGTYNRACSVEGCEKPNCSGGLCQKHYFRLKNHGTTDDPPPKSHCSRGHKRTPSNTGHKGACLKCQRNKNHRRRCAAAGGDDVDVDVLGDRSGWICQLCLEPVERDLHFQDPKSKTIDHIIPLLPPEGQQAGTHAWDNCQLAHRVCNTSKGNRA